MFQSYPASAQKPEFCSFLLHLAASCSFCSIWQLSAAFDSIPLHDQHVREMLQNAAESCGILPGVLAKKQWESCEKSTSVGTTHLLSVCGAVAVLDEVASPPKCLGDGWAASLLLPLFSLASLHTSVRFFAPSHGVPASHRLPHFTWSTRKLPLNMLKLLSSTRTFLSFRGHIRGSHYTTHSGDHFKVSYLSCLPISSQVFNQVCLAQAFFDAWTDWHCQLARFAVTAQPCAHSISRHDCCNIYVFKHDRHVQND